MPPTLERRAALGLVAGAFAAAGCASAEPPPSPAEIRAQEAVDAAAWRARLAFSGPRLDVLVAGEGPPLLLIPGLGSSPDVWRAQAPILSADRTLHLVHLAGFAGLAGAEGPAGPNEGPFFDPAVAAIAAYMREAELSNVEVMGHSLGGEAALALAARHPDLVSRVCSVDALTYDGLLFGPETTPDGLRPRAEAFRTLVLNADPGMFRTMQAAAIARLVASEDDRTEALDLVLASSRHAIAQAAYDLMTIDLRPELAGLKAPVHVIHGHAAAMGLSVEAVDALYRGAYAVVPGTTFRRIDGALHFVMKDRPDAFLEAVQAWLASGA